MKKNLVVFSLTSLALVTALATSIYTQTHTALVDVYDVKYSSVDDYVISSGTVEYINKKNVKCPVSAVVDEVYIKEGDTVEKGDRLFDCTVIAQENYSSASVSSDDIYMAIASGDYSVFSDTDFKPSQNTEVLGEKQTVYADYGGTVTAVNFSDGDTVGEKSVMAVIVPSGNMQVSLNVNESQMSDLKTGQKVTITGVGFKNSKYHGEVTHIAVCAGKTGTSAGKAATVEVSVSIDDADEKIKSGYTAKCKIVTSTDDKSIIVPYEYICCEDDGKEYVYIYKNGYAKKKYITTATEYPSGVKVTKGLKKGDTVVCNPEAVRGCGRAELRGE